MKYRYDIVVAGWIGLKGSLDRITACEKEFADRYPNHYIGKIKSGCEKLIASKKIEEAIANYNYLVIGENNLYSEKDKSDIHTIIYTIEKGGLYRALWDMSIVLNKGFEINRYSIPILQETVEVCDFFNENLYEVDGTGAYLIYSEDAVGIIKQLELAGISAGLIGYATKELAKQIVRDDDIQYLDKPRKRLME